MSQPHVNPYQPPLAEKLTDAVADYPRRRNVALFVLLYVVTFTIYGFYIVYRWAKELNGLAGRVKFDPVLMLVVSIFTCGIAALVFECLYAFDVVEYARRRNIEGRIENLPTWVITCNVLAMLISLIPFRVIVGLPLGILATTLLQVELNKLADDYARAGQSFAK